MTKNVFEQRKLDHLTLSLDPSVQAKNLAGFDQVSLPHEALPPFDLKAVELSSVAFGLHSTTPFYFCGMTAGHPDALVWNQRLAEAAAARGWFMGIGSQRRTLDHLVKKVNAQAKGDSYSEFDFWKKLKKKLPKLQLIGNIGITQLVKTKTSDLVRLCEELETRFLAIHLNPLQEAIQPEGTPFFKGAEAALAKHSEELLKQGYQVVVKETGCGFSKATLGRLRHYAISAVDVSGLGGTHWGRIEGKRAITSDSIRAAAAETFSNWGVPTVQSIVDARGLLREDQEVWASGGVRSGLDAAKSLFLGANQVGYAFPALKAAAQGAVELDSWMQQQEFELSLALFATGCENPLSMRKTGAQPLAYSQKDGSEWRPRHNISL